MSHEKPSMSDLLKTVIRSNASDLHINVGQPPIVRESGRMRRLEANVLNAEDTTAFMKSITPAEREREFEEKGEADFTIEFESYRFRVAAFRDRGRIGLVCRRLPN